MEIVYYYTLLPTNIYYNTLLVHNNDTITLILTIIPIIYTIIPTSTYNNTY